MCSAIHGAQLCVPTIPVGFPRVVIWQRECCLVLWLRLSCTSMLAASTTSTTRSCRRRCSSPRTLQLLWRRLPLRQFRSTCSMAISSSSWRARGALHQVDQFAVPCVGPAEGPVAYWVFQGPEVHTALLTFPSFVLAFGVPVEGPNSCVKQSF